MSKKIVQLKHKDLNVYPVTYSLAIVHKGELLYDFLENVDKPDASDFDIKDLSDTTGLRATWSNKLDTISDLSDIRSGASLGLTSLQSDSLKTINNESLIGSGNIEIQGGGGSIFGDHIFPHDGPEAGTDVPIKFIGYKGNSEDDGYNGDNYLKIGNDHALLSGKYTSSDGKTSLFNFGAAGFDFKRFHNEDHNNELLTRFSVKNDNIYLSGRHINFLCLNKNGEKKDLTRDSAIIFGDDNGELYAHFGEHDLNRFRVKTEGNGLFVLNDDGILTEHNRKIRFEVHDSEFNIRDREIEFNWYSNSNSHSLVLNQNGIEGLLKGIKYDFDDNGILRINGNDGVAVFGMRHGDYTNYAVFNNDIHIGSEEGSFSKTPDYSNDIIKVKSDGRVFVKGIGEFDGTNVDTAQSLQDAIGSGGLNEEAAIVIAAALNDLNDRLLAIENANVQNA